MSRVAIFLYGSIVYVCFLGVFLYAIGFMGNFMTPTTLDGPLNGSLGVALLVNALLLSIFAIQHSVMARPGFKRWLTRWVPEPAERSTYVLATCVALVLMFWLWRPMGGVIWEVESTPLKAAIYSVYGLGWVTVLIATFLIDHFDLFGFRQVWLHFRGIPYTPPKFNCPGPYKIIRHPLYIGWLITFWAVPMMSWAHLLFAIGCTGYILVAIQLEERDLITEHGQSYRDYKSSVPMLIPRLKPKVKGTA